MNTDLITQFRTVIESGSIVKAAEVLHMTPGALSRAMKRLDIELGSNLFAPAGRNVIPTQAGKSFYRSSDEILRSIRSAKQLLHQKNVEFRPVRMSTFEVFSTHFLSSAIANEYLKGPITLLERGPGQIEESVLDRSADCGITYIPQLHIDLDFIEIGRMAFGVFRSVNSKAINLPFAIPITDLGANILKVTSLDGWPNNIPRTVEYRFETFETALDLASRGKCKICCPKFIVALENERLKKDFNLVEEKQDFDLPHLNIYLVKRKDALESTWFKDLAKALRALNKK